MFLNVSTVKQACSGCGAGGMCSHSSIRRRNHVSQLATALCRWSEIGLEVPISTAALLFQTAGLAVTCVLVNGVEVQLSPSKAGADSPLPLEAPSLETVTAAHIRHFKDDLSGHVASVPMPSVLDAPLQHAHVTVAFRFGLRNDYGTMLCHGGAGAGPAQVRLEATWRLWSRHVDVCKLALMVASSSPMLPLSVKLHPPP